MVRMLVSATNRGEENTIQGVMHLYIEFLEKCVASDRRSESL